LVSRRENKIGIGKTPTKDPTNQWWLRGFEEALRGVGTDGTPSPTTAGGLTREENTLTRNGSQLYKFFVRGEVIPGTLSDKKTIIEGVAIEVKEKVSSKVEGKKEKKRKRDREEDDESRKLRKEKKKKSKKQKTDSSESATPIEQDSDPRKAKKK
jgi:nucleolar protein TMA23